MSTTIKHYSWIALISLLLACQVFSPQQAGSPTASTEVDSNAIHTQVAGTANAMLTQIAAITPTALPTATSTPLPLVVLDGLRVAYIIEGDLYVQDSGGQPEQLTTSGQNRAPIFSDDGQKIVFYRGDPKEKFQLYTINADESGEQVLVTNSLLVDLHLGYDESAEPLSQAFVPGTHQLLFSTEQFPATALRGGDVQLEQNFDLLLVDTDTGKIKQLQARGQGSAFQISPDGKLGIWKEGHIDVIGLDGKIVRRNLAPLSSSSLYMATTQWIQDLSKIYIMPLDPDAGAQGNSGVAEPRAIWQYPTDGREAVEIRLSPPLMGYMFSISPDWNWVVYTFADFPQETQETATPGIYLGNLRDGTTQLIQRAESFDLPISPKPYDWSPDSAHFIFDDYQDRMYMGNIHGEIAPLNSSRLIGWIDASRYLYGVSAMGEIGKEEKVGVMQLPAGKRRTDFTFVFMKK